MSTQQFEVVFHPEEDGGVMVEIPADVVAALGTRKRPPVRAGLNGYVYRTTVSVYGGKFFIPVRKEIRQAAGLTPGERLQVTLELDDEPRTVEPPDDLRDALAAAEGAQAVFDRLAFTHRKEYVNWITEAKRPETRRRRVEQTVTRLLEGTAAR
jgi:hypothetical protein